jgi:hypothetical protein
MASTPGTAAPVYEVADLKSPKSFSTSNDISDKLDAQETVNVIEALYSPSEEALQLPPGAGGEGDDAFADEPSVFDDPSLRKFYWPRKNYEGIRRFFPDFKWTVAEEKKYFVAGILY